MDFATAQEDGTRELLVCDLSPAEIDQFREWFCYTKPFGRSMKVVALPKSRGGSIFCVRATGTDPGPSENSS
jgi:hypothetical protein